MGIAKAYEQRLERAAAPAAKKRPATGGPVSRWRSLDIAVNQAYHFLHDQGHGWLAYAALVEWWDVDRVRLLSELRCVIGEYFSAEVLAKFDR